MSHNRQGMRAPHAGEREGQFLDAAIDVLSAHICVLNSQGVILAVNKAWRRFYARNTDLPGDDSCFLGTNYLHICSSASGANSDEAGPMSDGIRRVAAGELEEFHLEYPCHSPNEKRWFIARVSRFEDGSGRLVVAHENITARKAVELELQNSETMFRHFFERNSSVMLLIDPQTGALVNANQAACRFYGYTKEELLKLTIRDINILSQQQIALEIDRARRGNCNFFNFRHRLATGVVRDVEVYSTSTVVEGETLLFSTIHDITDRKTAEEQLKLAASVFIHAREGIMITDMSGIILDVNETFSRITGFDKAEVLGHNPRLLSSGRQTSAQYEQLWRSLADKGHWYGELWNRRKSGELYVVLETISAVCDEEGRVKNYVSLMTDITAMKEHEHELEHVAHYDALTQLPNRVLMFDRLRQSTTRSHREATSVAVAFMDLDGFKSVNDMHGHNVGDALLIEVSHNVKDTLREGDTLARIGGDEFVAILADLADPCDFEPVVRRMLHAAGMPVVIDGINLKVSASVGVALFPQDEVDADLLLRHADQAMYEAKQAGKNRFHVFDTRFDAEAQAKLQFLGRVTQALNRQEFKLYFQPKVDSQTGSVRGWEALLRWEHPEKGLLNPAEFLPVVSDHPLIIDLGEWVTRNALEIMSEWHQDGLGFEVSVNISARELQDTGLVKRLEMLVGAHPELPAHSLQLEVLESTALEDVAKVSAVMRACKDIGVTFALDDFGTGYSSLTYLKHLPAEVLKIDKSFVRGMTHDPTDRAIVESVIALARAFGKEVIAEGVESAQHAALLGGMGCQIIQGYGVAKPMPACEVPGWLADWDHEQRALWLDQLAGV